MKERNQFSHASLRLRTTNLLCVKNGRKMGIKMIILSFTGKIIIFKIEERGNYEEKTSWNDKNNDMCP